MQENRQKIKLLKLIELLRQETDELHTLSTKETRGRFCRLLSIQMES